ncbi:hypothetical protein WH50_11430 [Pokkaliibacter plantistimulans]|uniref:Permuted papain-like amidase YaeF/Yiix C92 family enzyme n=1 Tax=Pokkaliibacter plantistimulans TaxID=1635171 RepID=A0ABX5M088_9GAMM|nr:YiiX/YebB-like N1pC/P60 family cysteine hydrolase [Pokkaliibacter plantistimulans]PXF31133.1 hypothetical protein WH50_11430 [Pokkaliibacter plantistimulans]
MAMYPNTLPTADQVNNTASWLTVGDLRRGDIIAVRSRTGGSGMIRVTTNSPFSHLMLYMGNGDAIDAMPTPGVTKETLYMKLANGGYSFAGVFRHKTATDSQIALAVNWARSQAGKPYDNVSAARVGLQPGARTGFLRYSAVGAIVTLKDINDAASSPMGEDASFMCSELVFRAFQVAGIPLSDKPAATIGPGSILNVQQLYFVGRLEGAK